MKSKFKSGLSCVASLMTGLMSVLAQSPCDVSPCLNGESDAPCGSVAPTLVMDRVIDSFDLNSDGVDEFEFILSSGGNAVSDSYSIYYLIKKSPTVLFLKDGVFPAMISKGDKIGPEELYEPNQHELFSVFSIDYIRYRTLFGGFDATDLYASAKSVRELVTAYLGFQYLDFDGTHFGWVRFERPCAKAWVPFALSEVLVHPIPNSPVYAGYRPTGPELRFSVRGEEMILTWPIEAVEQGFILEMSTGLDSPANWVPVSVSQPGYFKVRVASRVFYRLSRS